MYKCDGDAEREPEPRFGVVKNKRWKQM